MERKLALAALALMLVGCSGGSGESKVSTDAEMRQINERPMSEEQREQRAQRPR